MSGTPPRPARPALPLLPAQGSGGTLASHQQPQGLQAWWPEAPPGGKAAGRSEGGGAEGRSMGPEGRGAGNSSLPNLGEEEAGSRTSPSSSPHAACQCHPYWGDRRYLQQTSGQCSCKLGHWPDLQPLWSWLPAGRSPRMPCQRESWGGAGSPSWVGREIARPPRGQE